MTKDRLIQLVAAVVLVIGAAASGIMLPVLLKQSEQHQLRYTDISVEGAPPIVALGQAIGVLRGLIVDYLWIKVHIMKEQGLFYEVMADSELITKLQPRFAAVWAFHGHNMAYNISVATHTEAERWEWVNAGINLVRNEGLRYNPNDLELHKELAFWFAHKIEGYADDAHLYYKTRFTQKWHYLLGEPPIAWEDRKAWIKEVADAADTLDEAERRTPGVKDLVQRFQDEVSPLDTEGSLKLNSRFLFAHGEWKAVTRHVEMAEATGMIEQLRAGDPLFRAFDDVASDAAAQPALKELLAHVRKRVLLDEFNMDPQVMYEYTRDYGPIDWRHGQAHALYWSLRGRELGELRSFTEENIYKIVNNDRLVLQGMQALARHGRITFIAFSNELPSRMPEPLWIDAIVDQFEQLYIKHENTRGAGGDTYIAFIQNFAAGAIREWYRSGETEKAQALLDQLDEWFGAETRLPNVEFSMPLDVFVENRTRGEYTSNPEVAPSEVAAGLRYGFRVGIGQDEPEVLRNAIQFSRTVTDIFKKSENYDYTNKFGRGRLSELVSRLEVSVESAYLQLMIDPTLPLSERSTIWRKTDQYVQSMMPDLRARVYDLMMPQLRRQMENSPLSRRYSVSDLFPAPPNLEAYRQRIAEQEAAEQKRLEQQRQRDQLSPQ